MSILDVLAYFLHFTADSVNHSFSHKAYYISGVITKAHDFFFLKAAVQIFVEQAQS